jgi:hypothetical protein
MHRLAFQMLDLRHAQSPRLERSHTRRDHHGAGDQPGAGGGRHMKLTRVQSLQLRHLLSQVKRGVERFGLLEQTVDQFLGTANRQRRNVVNRFVGIQLGALTTRAGQRIDDVCADPQQTEFEYLKQAHGTGADDDGVDGQGAGSC